MHWWFGDIWFDNGLSVGGIFLALVLLAGFGFLFMLTFPFGLLPLIGGIVTWLDNA